MCGPIDPKDFPPALTPEQLAELKKQGEEIEKEIERKKERENLEDDKVFAQMDEVERYYYKGLDKL